jgi:hypothetical protein
MVEPTKNHQKGCNKQHHNLCVFLIFMGPLGPRSPPVDRWLMIPELLKNDLKRRSLVRNGGYPPVIKHGQWTIPYKIPSFPY